MVYGGLFGCLARTLIGNAGVAWGNQGPISDPDGPLAVCGLWVGGGTACENFYLQVPPPQLPPP